MSVVTRVRGRWDRSVVVAVDWGMRDRARRVRDRVWREGSILLRSLRLGENQYYCSKYCV